MFSAAKGGLVCNECDGEVRDGMFLDGSTLYTMQYIESSTIEKLYTFNVKPEVLEKFGRVMGRLMKMYVDKEFKSLEILETLLNTIERHDIVSTDEILQRADEVMYEYKRKHKEKYLKQLEK